MIDAARGAQAIVPAAQVEQLELVGVGAAILWVLQIDAADPIALALEKGDEVMADETTGAGHKNLGLLRHGVALLGNDAEIHIVGILLRKMTCVSPSETSTIGP